MANKARQDVYLGRAIKSEVCRLARSSFRTESAQVVYLCTLALDAPAHAPVSLVGVQLDDQDGRVSVWADVDFFRRIEGRIGRGGYHSGESRSEAYRALILEGIAIDRAAHQAVRRLYGLQPQEATA